MGSFSIYNWRILIFKSDLPANAKYIGCYLSTYMNEHGDNCYPSIKRICHETGLSNKTVIKYIQVLRDTEWLEAKKKGFDGQAWAHNQYYPNVPIKVVEELHHVTKGGVTEGERRCTSGQKAVEEVHTSSIDNSVDRGIEYSHPPKPANGVPYSKIVDLYHSLLPNNPQIASLSINRKTQIKARWNNGLPDLEAWETFFNHVSESRFLTGRVNPTNGRKVFTANIDFLIKENNVLKIIEGNYHE